MDAGPVAFRPAEVDQEVAGTGARERTSSLMTFLADQCVRPGERQDSDADRKF